VGREGVLARAIPKEGVEDGTYCFSVSVMSMVARKRQQGPISGYVISICARKLKAFF